MALTNQDRALVWSEFMQQNKEPVGILKADLRAAVDSSDAWFDGIRIAFGNSMPEPARSSLSDAQKDSILMRILVKRVG